MKYVSAVFIGACLVSALFSPGAYGGIHKCVKNGKVTWQEQPCPVGTEVKSSISASASMAGCYETTMTAVAGSDESATALFEVKGGSGKYVVMNHGDRKGSSHMPMRDATSEEIKLLRGTYDVESGIVVDAPKDPDWRPIGIYRIRNESDKYFFYMVFANGLATRVPCPPPT